MENLNNHGKDEKVEFSFTDNPFKEAEKKKELFVDCDFIKVGTSIVLDHCDDKKIGSVVSCKREINKNEIVIQYKIDGIEEVFEYKFKNNF